MKNEEIKGKISEIGTTEIKYKKWDNQDGPMFSISKSTVFMIKYQNGSMDVLNANTPALKKRAKEEQEAYEEKIKEEREAEIETNKKVAEQRKIDSIITVERMKAKEEQKAEAEKKDAELKRQLQDEATEKEAIKALEEKLEISKSELIRAKVTLQEQYDKLEEIKLFQLGRSVDKKEEQISGQRNVIEKWKVYIKVLENEISAYEAELEGR